MINDIDEWVRYGMDRGWCGPVVCATHDGVPMSEEEEADYENGYDACVAVIRPYNGPVEAAAVESNHSPSRWRK